MVKYLLITLLLTLLLPTITFASGSYSGGDGQPATPFQIAEPNDLIEMSQHSEDWDKHFILTADINLNLAEPNTFTTALIAPDIDNTNYDDFDGTPFTGTFDGNGYAIQNLSIDTAGANNDFLGLFGGLNSGVLQNLGLEHAHITGGDDSEYIGGMTGGNSGTISNCSVTAGITGDGIIGGLVGINNGTVTNCYATGYISGDRVLGGLVGAQNWGTRDGIIINSYAACDVFGSDGSRSLGGLVGSSYIEGIIRNCYATGNVTGGTGSYRLGGIIGNIGPGNIISNCYATGNVAAGSNSFYLGGLIALSDNNTVTNCYSTGNVSGGDLSEYLGGLIGDQHNTSLINCYFLNSSGPNNGFGVPLDDSRMRFQSSFVDWDFVNETANGDNDLWRMGFQPPYYPIFSEQRDIPGDLAGSYGIDLYDYAAFANFWACTNCFFTNQYCSGADIDHSGVVAPPDLMQLTANWLTIGNIQEPNAALTAHWKLDEISGLIASDSSGNHYNADLVNSPTWQPLNGQINGAIELNGVDQYIDAPFILNPADGPFTACAWVKGGNPDEKIICQTDGTGIGRNWLQTPSGYLGTNVKTASGSFLVSTYSGHLDGNWHHVAVVWDGARRHVYADGAEVAADSSDQGEPLESCDGRLFIGAHKTLAADLYLTSLIDDVRIYQRTLSPTEIQDLGKPIRLHLKLDESSGTIAQDSSGFNNHATLINTPNWQPAGGKIDGAIELDGTDNYIKVPYILNPGKGSFTACAWIKGGQPNEKIICQTDGTGTGRAWLRIDSDGYLSSALIVPSGSFLSSTYSGYTNGRWHHVAIVWDGSRRFLYADGRQVASDPTDLGVSLESNDGSLYIGAHKYLIPNEFWTGMIDDVRIYARPLTAQEIKDFSDPMLLHLKLDESSGSIAYDNTIYSNDADLINSPTWQPTGGQIDGALELDGIDQYIDIPFTLNPTDGPFTACAWVKGGQPDEKIICQTDGTGIGRNWLNTESTGYLGTNVRIPSGSNLTSTYSDHLDGYWHHVALTWDGARRHLYADGTEVAADPADLGAALESCDGRLFIGAHKNLTSGTFWTGLIDDTRIYNRALTQPQIQELANMPN